MEAEQKTRIAGAAVGLSQLTLVEHALCPLDARLSLRENLVHECEYFFTDAQKHRRKARVRVNCPDGLSANDEFFLWGLLALTFSEREPTIDFYATPHFCLTRLQKISSGSKGGKSYALFRQAIERLSMVRYRNERFYDPIRREHRDVSFGFFSYSLPVDPDTSRAWRIVWDPLFFEFCQAAGSQLSFDLETYRELDCASRRLFLLLKKLFWRKKVSPSFDVRHLAVDVLGFSSKSSQRKLNDKLKSSVDKLVEREIINLPSGVSQAGELIEKKKKGVYCIRFVRGNYFRRPASRSKQAAIRDSALFEPLQAIGFDDRAIVRILNDHPAGLIQLWSDVTLAALERRGRSFFRRSPQAYFMDNIRNAAEGHRTPADWYWELQKEEERKRARAQREDRGIQAAAETDGDFESYLSADGRAVFEEVIETMLKQFRSAGQPETVAQKNANRFATEHMRKRYQAEVEKPLPLKKLFG